MNLLHLFLSCSAFFAVLTGATDEYEIKNKPLLTVKLSRSFQTQSFIDGVWTEPVDFDDSPLAAILELCTDPDEYTCWSHNDGIQKYGLHATNTMSNVIFVANQRDHGESYLCVTSWSGFDHECILNAGSPEGCARTLPKKMQQSFMCFKQHLYVLNQFGRIFQLTIRVFTEVSEEDKHMNWPGGFVDMDDNAPGFFNRTGVFITFTRPIKGAPNFRELEYKLLEDYYQHFAEKTGSHMMVRACTDEATQIITSVHGLGDPMVFNVNKSLHPVLGDLRDGDYCLDNAKLAYSVPLDKQRDEYYVCHGDLPRDMIGRHRGGGLYCWVDKQLNLDLRCNTVPAFMWLEDRTFALFDEEEYAEWYSDCPEDLRTAVMAATKAKFAQAEKEQKQFVLREFDEL